MRSLLHELASKNNLPGKKLNLSEKFSVYYHNIFEYPLTFSELVKWTPINPPEISVEVDYNNGHYYVKGGKSLIYKRDIRNRNSQKKLKIAQKAAKILSLIPSVIMVGITGSLAMHNAEDGGDVDLLIITKNGRLWSTRVISYLLLKFLGLSLRKPNIPSQKDKLCLNMWLDESDLVWSKNERNFYTAHEILQVIPIINKNRAYERFILKNMWVFNYWPYALDKKPDKNSTSISKLININPIETLLYKAQYLYMKDKLTFEVIKPTRAIFHPINLSKLISKKLHLT